VLRESHRGMFGIYGRLVGHRIDIIRQSKRESIGGIITKRELVPPRFRPRGESR
jgi:hypothetical protein